MQLCVWLSSVFNRSIVPLSIENNDKAVWRHLHLHCCSDHAVVANRELDVSITLDVALATITMSKLRKHSHGVIDLTKTQFVENCLHHGQELVSKVRSASEFWDWGWSFLIEKELSHFFRAKLCGIHKQATFVD